KTTSRASTDRDVCSARVSVVAGTGSPDCASLPEAFAPFQDPSSFPPTVSLHPDQNPFCLSSPSRCLSPVLLFADPSSPSRPCLSYPALAVPFPCLYPVPFSPFPVDRPSYPGCSCPVVLCSSDPVSSSALPVFSSPRLSSSDLPGASSGLSAFHSADRLLIPGLRQSMQLPDYH